jgi:hypothetical protein
MRGYVLSVTSWLVIYRFSARFDEVLNMDNSAKPHRPEQTLLYQIVEKHYPEFRADRFV